MTDGTEKKPRAKPEGPRNHVITIDGKEWFVRADSVRVASRQDQDKALDGDMPRGKVVDAKATMPASSATER